MTHHQTRLYVKPTQLKTFVPPHFHGIHLGASGGHSNLHILKTTNINFFTKHPTKQSNFPMPHRQTWPCSKPTQLKTFVHQDFHGIHLGIFGGHSNPHIPKTMNFQFFTKHSPKQSSYVVPHRQTWPCAESTELQTFVHHEFYGIHLGMFGGHSNLHIS